MARPTHGCTSHARSRTDLLVPLGVAGLLIAPAAHAQVVRDLPIAYQELRFEDRALPTGDPANALKRVPLGGDAWVSFGGELRERLDRYAAPMFDITGPTRDAVLLNRLLLQADIHLSGAVRTFVQVGSFTTSGRHGMSLPTDVDRLDLVQGFVDLSADVGAAQGTLRAGRQEMAFGSERLISVRESPNIRQSFDGGRVTLRAGALTLDLFGIRPVDNRPGILDDRAAPGQSLWGVYGSVPPTSPTGIGFDAYYIGRVREHAAYARGTGRDERHTFGLRLWRKEGPLDYDLEAMVQAGSFGQAPVLAWRASADVGWTAADLPLRPRLGLKLDAASGDGGGRTMSAFDPLFPKYAYFTEAQLTEFINIASVFPSLTLAPTRRFAVTAGVDLLWRETTRDAVYLPPLTPLLPTARRGGRFTGVQTNLQAQWLLGEHLDLNLAWVHHTAGSALRAASGRSADYLGAWTSVRF